MSTTHIGKIGRLARSIRQILGERIEEGIPNKELVQWLNGLHHVKEVMAQRFGGRAITEQNLSEWRHSGHVEWLRREERRGLALQLLEQREEDAMEPGEALAEKEVSDRLGRELGMEMARLALALVEQEGDTEARWKRLCAVYREVSQMRRDDDRAERTRIQRERWQHELEVEEAAAEKQARKEDNLSLFAGCATQVSLKIMEEALRGLGGRPSAFAEAPARQAERAGGQVAVPAGEAQAAGAEGIRPNPSKSNRQIYGEGDRLKAELQTFETGKPHTEDAEGTESAEVVKDEGTGVRPSAFATLRRDRPGAEETKDSRDNADGRDFEGIETSPNDEEIRLNPSKSNQEIEDEAWLKAMNFI